VLHIVKNTSTLQCSEIPSRVVNDWTIAGHTGIVAPFNQSVPLKKNKKKKKKKRKKKEKEETTRPFHGPELSSPVPAIISSYYIVVKVPSQFRFAERSTKSTCTEPKANI